MDISLIAFVLFALHFLSKASASSTISFYTTPNCTSASEITNVRFTGILNTSTNDQQACHPVGDFVYGLKPTQLDPGCVLTAYLDNICSGTASPAISLSTCYNPSSTKQIGSWKAKCPPSSVSASPTTAFPSSSTTPKPTTTASASPSQKGGASREWLGLSTTQLAIVAAGLGFSVVASLGAL